MTEILLGWQDYVEEYSIYIRLLRRVFPLVTQELRRWQKAAQGIPSGVLRREALSSLGSKAFHCYGGGVMSLFNPTKCQELVGAIVAIQTISDYLDNLSDRALTQGCHALSYETLLEIHQAFISALDPQEPIFDFYRSYRKSVDCEDLGYLRNLVHTSRAVLSSFRHYSLVREKVLVFARLYSELQARKHLSLSEREKSMVQWFESEKETASKDQLTWWEFGAACGSTLGIFSLIGFSSMDELDQIPKERQKALCETISDMYFPSITGLHILLDYFIDQEEDKVHKDLNFMSYYPDDLERQRALEKFWEGARLKTSVISEHGMRGEMRFLKPWLHKAVVKGLLSMYLSDPKVSLTHERKKARGLCAKDGLSTVFLRAACSFVRRVKRF